MFLNLPRELRDEIYSLALSASNVIDVRPWKPRDLEIQQRTPGWYLSWVDLRREVYGEVCRPYLLSTFNTLAFNLLSCGNYTISTEAAVILHRETTFCSEDKYLWSTAAFWLTSIGLRNRNSLRNLNFWLSLQCTPGRELMVRVLQIQKLGIIQFFHVIFTCNL